MLVNKMQEKIIQNSYSEKSSIYVQTLCFPRHTARMAIRQPHKSWVILDARDRTQPFWLRPSTCCLVVISLNLDDALLPAYARAVVSAHSAGVTGHMSFSILRVFICI